LAHYHDEVFIDNCSHLIHICSRGALPAGLRLEIRAKFDKKKFLNYFLSVSKKS